MISNERIVPDASALSGWYKSSYSGGNQGECLEAARGFRDVPVRDSKAVAGPAVRFSVSAWSSFVTAVKDGLPTY